MAAGAVTAFVWGSSELSATLYEIIPGFAVNLVLAVVVSLLTRAPAGMDSDFDEARDLARRGAGEPETVPAG